MILNSPMASGEGVKPRRLSDAWLLSMPSRQEVVRLLAITVDVRATAFLGGVGSEIHAMGIHRDQRPERARSTAHSCGSAEADCRRFWNR